MGFGFPAAIGAKIGCPDEQVVCIAGDGSFQMNSQEMATAKINNVPVKVLIIDNRALGMVHQWQHLFYNDRFSFTELADNPDFVKLADAYGWRARRIEQTVYPMVAPGAPIDDIIGALDVTLGGVRVSEKGFGEAGRPRVKPSHEGVDE